MFNCEELKEKIEKHIPNSKVEVTNPRKDNEHFMVKVISKSFEGKNLIEQHRMIYDSLKEELDKGLHSLSIKTQKE